MILVQDPGEEGGAGLMEGRSLSVRTMSDLILKTNPVGKQKPAKNTFTFMSQESRYGEL